MIYLDTSYLVRLYWEEPGYEAVRELAASDHVCCAQHGEAELVAAFHRKLREGALPLRSYRAVFAQFESDRAANAFAGCPPVRPYWKRFGRFMPICPAQCFSAGPTRCTSRRPPSMASSQCIPMTATSSPPPGTSA